MTIRLYRARTPGTRNRSISKFEETIKSKPQKKLTYKKNRKYGRNNRGIITNKHRGGGHKRLYRVIDIQRNKENISGKIKTIEYDPNRNAYICLTNYENGEKKYILYPRNSKIGDIIVSGAKSSISIGNTLPLANIPLGTTIHNIEIKPGKGGQLVRAAGTIAKIIAKEGFFVTLRLPSGEIRLISQKCLATIGQIGNIDANNIRIGKAGSKRWLGKRPKVRGVVMNPIDHPHGGGEGKVPIGRKKPLTPWGRAALGIRSRKNHKYSDIYILRRRRK
uniref:Large ribosomal subunit protein uL2c n=1 Tax=Radula japonica TaxID=1068553 RepID=A0A4Y5P621_9MARC|nr:ribosomal protein L2 [Radula japonica]QCW58713.1 ribosomal protein L2 [Radula japonica]